MRAEEEMFRIEAGRIVTVMKDADIATVIEAEKDTSGNAVNSVGRPILKGSNPVAIIANSASPFPASRLGNYAAVREL